MLWARLATDYRFIQCVFVCLLVMETTPLIVQSDVGSFSFGHCTYKGIGESDHCQTLIENVLLSLT